MPLNLLNLRERGPRSLSEGQNGPKTRSPRFFQFGRGRVPTRGLIYSIVLHEVLFAATVVIPWNYWVPVDIPGKYQLTVIEKNGPLILPDLKPFDPAAPSGGAPEGNSGGGSGKSSAQAGQPFKGIVHRGPQSIVSNPERADNLVQTIRQPEIIDPPKLPSPLPLPNIVAIKATVPVLAAPSLADLQTEQTRSALHRFAAPADTVVVPPPVDIAVVNNPSLELPTVSPLPPLPVRRPRSAHARPTMPEPPSLSSRPSGNADRDLLVLSAILTSSLAPAALPPGELHGAFAVSPTPPPTTSHSDSSGLAISGGKNGAPTGTDGNGSGSTGTSGAGTGAGKIGTGNGSGGVGKGTGRAGSGPGAGAKGSGKGSGGSGGYGPAKGTGPGSGPGTTRLEIGSGAGGPFPGISIEGGTSAAITAASGMNVRTPGTYALTIVGSGASGGGLKDYGVFHHETVYTIYVDFAGTGGATWTMQYAVAQLPGSSTTALGVVSPPYPVEKHAPEYPADLATQYEGQLIVLAGVIDNEGKVQRLRVIQAPHARLAQSLMDSVQKCTFGAAEIGNTPVAVKFLVGAPISVIK